MHQDTPLPLPHYTGHKISTAIKIILKKQNKTKNNLLKTFTILYSPWAESKEKTNGMQC